jgi:hypothetical protein
MEFEPTNPMFERGKTIHALDGTATVISAFTFYATELLHKLEKIKQGRQRSKVSK